MLYHLIFTGSVRKDVSKFVEQSSIELIQSACQRLDIGGCLLYADGNFLIILEGVKENTTVMLKSFSAHPSLTQPIIMLKKPIETRYFDGFKLSFVPDDMSQPVEDPIFLNRRSLQALIPQDCPENISSIIDSFLTVQRVA